MIGLNQLNVALTLDVLQRFGPADLVCLLVPTTNQRNVTITVKKFKDDLPPGIEKCKNKERVIFNKFVLLKRFEKFFYYNAVKNS